MSGGAPSRRNLQIASIAAVAATLGAVVAASTAAPSRPPALDPEVRRVAESLVDAGFTGTRAFEWTQQLTDRAGSRLPGSSGDRESIEWGVETLEKLGFSDVRAEKVATNVWERGIETGEVTAPWPHPLFLTALGGSVPTPPSGIEAEILEVASLEALAGVSQREAKGKIVFFNRRTRRTLDGAGYGESVPVRGSGASRAAKLGAVGALIRSIGTDSNRTPHTGALRYETGVNRIPAAAISNPDADLLERLGRDNVSVRVRFTLGCRDRGQGQTANVIGDVRGRGKPEEIVVLGCHRDAWDLGTGAEDDAAGCGIVIEAARMIAGISPRPRRTVRVILYGNEEHGLAGGRAYAADHAAELPRHVAAIEADLGSGRPIGFSWNAGPSSRKIVEEIAELLAPLGADELTPGSLGGADVSRMLPAGVPLFSMRQDASRYFDWHHTANDTLDKVDADGIDRMTAAIAAFAYVAAAMPEPFERIPADKRVLPRF